MNDSKKDLNKADSIINHSLSRELRKNGKTTEEFEVMLNSLSLEEVIGLKLELATRAAGGLLYGFPLWHSIPVISKEAMIKYAISACKSKMEAAKLLGIDKVQLNNFIKKFDVINFFSNDGLTNKKK